MAGPLSGIAGSQVPFSTFQPGGQSSSTTGTSQTATQDTASGPLPASTQDAPVSSTQNSDTNTQDFTQREPQESVSESAAPVNENSPRGSLVDQLV